MQMSQVFHGKGAELGRADPLVREGPPGPATRLGWPVATGKGWRGRQPRTRASAPQSMQVSEAESQ